MPGGHYDFATGDSIATAQVSGVVALLLATRHGLTASAAYKLLQDTSTAPGSGSGNVAYAAGAVDACAAVTALVGRGTCTAQDTAGAPPEDRPQHLALH
jgi:subtilisin family serine protease